MSAIPRTLLCATAAALIATATLAADLPKDSPFAAPGAAVAPANVDVLQFAGVSTIGSQTMINLYDTQQKQGFWVQVGATVNGVTAVKYDSAHDQVTIRQNGAERTLPLRPPSAVVNGPMVAPSMPVAAAPATAATTAPTPPPPPMTEQARKEEEARMLVSDLLEIGMAQRKAYEEKAAAAAKAAQSQQQPASAGATSATAQPASTAATATGS